MTEDKGKRTRGIYTQKVTIGGFNFHHLNNKGLRSLIEKRTGSEGVSNIEETSVYWFFDQTNHYIIS